MCEQMRVIQGLGRTIPPREHCCCSGVRGPGIYESIDPFVNRQINRPVHVDGLQNTKHLNVATAVSNGKRCETTAAWRGLAPVGRYLISRYALASGWRHWAVCQSEG